MLKNMQIYHRGVMSDFQLPPLHTQLIILNP